MSGAYTSDVVPGSDIVPVVASADPIPGGPYRAIKVGVSGNLNITTIAGVERDNVPFFAGVIDPIMITHIRPGATGPATNVWVYK